jgi:2-polyprenyl-6-methoxyphenol hydroxylase-like FAD-dependent oxidoreductase
VEIIVIGAGVGGLAIARGLLAAGHRVRVYERAPARGTGGAALTIFSNGTAVLNDLGVSLDGVGARIDRLDALTAGGRLRTSMNIAHAAERYGFATKTLSRRHPYISLVSRLAKRNPANWRIPPLLGRLLPETSQTAMLARYSNRLTAPV